MTKTFCDRCGKEITKDFGWIRRRTLYTSIKLIPWEKHDEWPDRWSDRVDQYICPECEDSYVRWFMNPETEDGQ